MLQSMTGFGSAIVENAKITVTIEVKSLNSKFFDIYCRIPRNYSDKEIEIRNLLTQELERGKVEFAMSVTPKQDAGASTVVNRGLIKAYFKDLRETALEIGFEPSPTELLRMASMMPNVYNTDAATEDDAKTEWNLIKNGVMHAIHKCKEFRTQEGANTAAKFKEYINKIAELLTKVEEQDPNRIPAIRERLEKSIHDWVATEHFDQNRFEQELIYYVEKFDISEEKVRLRNHLEYFIQEMQIASVGKKLNFIAQEIGREINTIGSKANDAIIQRMVINMKDELEKIKEQTSNVL